MDYRAAVVYMANLLTRDVPCTCAELQEKGKANEGESQKVLQRAAHARATTFRKMPVPSPMLLTPPPGPGFSSADVPAWSRPCEVRGRATRAASAVARWAEGTMTISFMEVDELTGAGSGSVLPRGPGGKQRGRQSGLHEWQGGKRGTEDLGQMSDGPSSTIINRISNPTAAVAPLTVLLIYFSNCSCLVGAHSRVPIRRAPTVAAATATAAAILRQRPTGVYTSLAA